jgi:hypothetical protein
MKCGHIILVFLLFSILTTYSQENKLEYKIIKKRTIVLNSNLKDTSIVFENKEAKLYCDKKTIIDFIDKKFSSLIDYKVLKDTIYASCYLYLEDLYWRHNLDSLGSIRIGSKNIIDTNVYLRSCNAFDNIINDLVFNRHVMIFDKKNNIRVNKILVTVEVDVPQEGSWSIKQTNIKFSDSRIISSRLDEWRDSYTFGTIPANLTFEPENKK